MWCTFTWPQEQQQQQQQQQQVVIMSPYPQVAVSEVNKPVPQ
jgi:hypothetical protein